MKRIKQFKSFNDFVLNEAIVKYSPRLLSLLTSIYKDGWDNLTKDLVSMHNSDYDVSNNYIDVGEDGETVTFTNTKKAEKLFSELSEKDLQDDEIVKQMFSTQRQSIKINKFVRAFLQSSGKQYTDKQIEDFGYKFKSFAKNENNFKLVSGEDIAFWYNASNYEQIKSTLGSSCMREVDSIFFEIYTENPDKVQLLILMGRKDPNKIRGRALVWKAETSDDSYKSITFMDRVYYTDDSDLYRFQNYAKENGWGYKSNNNHREIEEIIIDGEELHTTTITVKLKNSDFSYYPYMDTLKYLREDGLLSSDPETGDLVLASVRGDYEVYCSECNNSGNTDCPDCNDGYVSCDDCHGRGYTNCEECGGTHEIECSDCDGNGRIKCEECEGHGEKDGEECEECDGKGDYLCGDCEGSGEVECEECDSDVDIRCNTCNTHGRVECSLCDGSGEIECEECSSFR